MAKTQKTLKGLDAAKERFIELRAEGRSYEAIAVELGVSRQTLQAWSKKLQNEIANASAVRMDALRARYGLLQQHQIECFGALLGKIKEELDKRDLSEVPTHRLLEVFLKYSAAMQAYSKPLEFVEECEPVEFALLEATRQTRQMP